MAAAVASRFDHSAAVARPRSAGVLACPCRVGDVSLVGLVRPEDAAADRTADGRRRQYWRRHHTLHEEPAGRSPSHSHHHVRRRRRDDARHAFPDRKRRRREGVFCDDGGRRERSYSTKSGVSSSRIRPAADSGTDDAYGAAKKQELEREREKEAARRSSGSANSRSDLQRACPGTSAAVPQHQSQAAPIARSCSAAVDRRPPPEKVETTQEDAEGQRKLDIQRKREEARRELDKMKRTVEFNNPFISPMDVLKP
ncbi:hypothetical protein ACP70R_005490 [Stipagrostis hirtigluma subsp. patula]